VQRLTGRPHTGGDAAAPPHRPCACRTIGGVGVTTPPSPELFLGRRATTTTGGRRRARRSAS
jgi:hypothetical protein